MLIFFDLLPLQDVGVNDEFLQYQAILKDLHDALTSKKSNSDKILVFILLFFIILRKFILI